MAGCTDCGSSEISLCQCDDGKNSFTVSTTITTIANPMTIAVSNVGQNTGAWAKVGQVVFIENYGYYKCTASTSTSITLAFPPSPFVGGAAYSLGSVDYDNAGTIPSGTKISPGGVKGDTGTTGSTGIALLAIDHNQAGANNPTSQTAYSVVQETTTVAAATTPLNATGDSLRIKARFFYDDAAVNYTGVTAVGGKIVFAQASTGVTIVLREVGMNVDLPGTEIDVILSRSATAGCVDFISSSSIYTNIAFDYTNETGTGNVSQHRETVAQGGGLIDFTADFTIQFWAKVSNGASAIKVGFYSIEFLNKL